MNRMDVTQGNGGPRASGGRPRFRNGDLKNAAAVRVGVENIVLPTYMPAPPDKNPMFLEKRVYQGSSGKVYPLPFTDRIAEKPVEREWKAVWIENEFIRVMVLPEIGGRIHVLQDKSNGYDVIYNQPVIKPALVGLAGPWISGGIEFNWPQHHRPATFLPVDFEIEERADGSKTIWCGDHDPMARMKGMHGVCLHPGRAYLELKVRAYNRTPFTQTFLWWANVATRVHEEYQSFFPPDVYYVADHARRSMSEYPLCRGRYYGVNYGERARSGVPENEIPRQFVPPNCEGRRAKGEGRKETSEDSSHGPPSSHFAFHTSPFYPPNDLSFYGDIPVPTSYMCMGSKEDFFGGYDYRARAGIVHYANHHISPGKKQWTWGNHEFGYAWDRNLTDADERGEFGPYIEIMAGVYTDNQPDFSFLQPGETKTWSQYWYPIREIGPAQRANLEAAISLSSGKGGLQLGVAVTRNQPKAVVTIAAERGHSCPQQLPMDGAAPIRCPAVRRFVAADRNVRAPLNSYTAHGRRPPSQSVSLSTIASFKRDLSPAKPLVETIKLPKGIAETDLLISVRDAAGHELISYRPRQRAEGKVPPPATEPPAPADIASADELYLTGLHLEQYRHATRSPVPYWQEALHRDPLDARCNNAMGLWRLRRGEFAVAERHFRKAIERLTRRNSNPYDGEAYYNLGLCLRYQADWSDGVIEHWSGAKRSGPSLHRPIAPSLQCLEAAYAAFYKATWNQAWACAGYHALAETDCLRQDWATALEHLDRSLRLDTDNLRARNLKVMVLRKLGKTEEANSLLSSTLLLDALDWWARHLDGEELACDLQVRLDLAHDYARSGFINQAIEALSGVSVESRLDKAVLPGSAGVSPVYSLDDRPTRRRDASATRLGYAPSGATVTARDLPDQSWGAQPLVHYTLGWLEWKRGDAAAASKLFKQAALAPADYCFPSRLEEIAILETAMRVNPSDARAPYYLGNLLYDRRRHEEAIRFWERSAKLDPNFSTVWRNLGIGWFNIRRQPAKARAAYDKAFKANPTDARLLYERDQLWKRLGESPAKRLRELERHPALVRQRDDLSVELCALYNQTGEHEEASQLLASRQFQPWEGGEGGALGQYVRAQLALGRAALAKRDFAAARSHFERALASRPNLGEAKHLLANQSDIHYWLGCACAGLGEQESARRHWIAAANFKGDFQEMSVRAFSEMTYYSALSSEKIGHRATAKKLLRELLDYARNLRKTEARIEYFATSLPTMLLFDDDLQSRRETTALFLEAQARLGLGRTETAKSLLRAVLRRDPNHALAADLFGGMRLRAVQK